MVINLSYLARLENYHSFLFDNFIPFNFFMNISLAIEGTTILYPLINY